MGFVDFPAHLFSTNFAELTATVTRLCDRACWSGRPEVLHELFHLGGGFHLHAVKSCFRSAVI